MFFFFRFGSRTGEPSGGSGNETNKPSSAKTASARSSMDSCSLTRTCTPATRTTTGPQRAWRQPRYQPRASPSSTPWTSTPCPRRPCSRRRPTPYPLWPPAWCPRPWLVCRAPASTASTTWTTSAIPLLTPACPRRRAHTRLRLLLMCTGTLVTPV